MLDINASPITLKTIIDEDGSFTFMITPSMAFSSPEKFRWEITFGQGAPHRGVITFKAGEPDSQSIPQSIDPDEHYQLRVFRVSDNNNDADDALVFQQQSEHLPPLSIMLRSSQGRRRSGNRHHSSQSLAGCQQRRGDNYRCERPIVHAPHGPECCADLHAYG